MPSIYQVFSFLLSVYEGNKEEEKNQHTHTHPHPRRDLYTASTYSPIMYYTRRPYKARNSQNIIYVVCRLVHIIFYMYIHKECALGFKFGIRLGHRSITAIQPNNPFASSHWLSPKFNFKQDTVQSGMNGFLVIYHFDAIEGTIRIKHLAISLLL